ncbi:MAG: endonuclease MutS2 [Thermaceae bacterium]
MRDALEALEFPEIRKRLAQKAQTPMGRALAEALSPLSQKEALFRQTLTEEALAYPLDLSGVGDLERLYAKAQRGERLSGPELLAAYEALKRAVALKAELLPLRSGLSQVAEGIGTHTAFLGRIPEALDEEGSVKDDASPRLREIRSRLRPLREEILNRLYTLMDRHREAIQERFITLRRDRYVIPVKASHQHLIPGILLDESESGATLYIEPAQVVHLHNRLEALRLEEEREVARILLFLSGLLGEDPEVEGTVQALGLLDLVQAQARLSRELDLRRPRFGPLLRLKGAFHPLIPNPVRNSLTLDENTRLLLITGPNMGGKTALLKTVGLAALMAQSGLFVPAEEAELPFFEGVYADIGDEQSIQESLSTFASHLLRIKAMLQEATKSSLILIDELGSGTDPEEGAALSQALLEAFLAKGCYGLVSTHLSPLKAFAQRTPGVKNASFRFDLEALRPTYELLLGVPGRSYALAIAKRLALDEGVLARAEALLPEGGRLEALLEELERERLALEEEKRRLETLLRDLEKERAELAEEKARWERERQSRLSALEEEILAAIRKTEAELKALKERAKTAGKRDALRELLELRARYQKPKPPPPALAPGTLVEVPYGGRGRVVELREDDALVQVGAVKLLLKAKDLKPLPEEPAQEKPPLLRPVREAKEVDLRGLKVEEALLEVEEAIREALALGLSSVRLLHGKGTGALRQAIREALKRDKRVRSFHDAPPHEGGHGVTVVEL